MITDPQFNEFLVKLHASTRAKNGVLLTEWESAFLAGWLAANVGSRWLTSGRREAVNKMWMRYGGEINHPHPMDQVRESAQIAPADPDGCESLLREDGRQQRCNAPATCREPGRLRYCATHGQQVQQDCKRAGIKFCLVNFSHRDTENTEVKS